MGKPTGMSQMNIIRKPNSRSDSSGNPNHKAPSDIQSEFNDKISRQQGPDEKHDAAPSDQPSEFNDKISRQQDLDGNHDAVLQGGSEDSENPSDQFFGRKED